MNVLLYGATGMVGQGVARECELDPGIERIVTVAVGVPRAALTQRRVRSCSQTSPTCRRSPPSFRRSARASSASAFRHSA